MARDQTRHAVTEAERLFTGTCVQLTEDGSGLEHKNGQCHLGAAVGTSAFIVKYVSDKVSGSKWSADIGGPQAGCNREDPATCCIRHVIWCTPLSVVFAEGHAGPSQTA